MLIKGAPEWLIKEGIKFISNTNQELTVDNNVYESIYSQLSIWSDQCFRNIALCYYNVDFNPYENNELIKNPFEKFKTENYVLYGIVGIQDPLRSTVKESIDKCKQAGITVRMVTGDNPQTAFAIAKESGIIEENTPKDKMDYHVITGNEFNQKSGGVREVFFGKNYEGYGKHDKYEIANIDDNDIEAKKKEALQLIKEGHNLKKK